MSFWQNGRPGNEEDEIDKAIRQSLLARAPKTKPSDDVWERIRQQVTAGPPVRSRRRPPTRRFRFMLPPVMQGLAAIALLALLGFSLTSNLWIQSYQFGLGMRATPTTVEPMMAAVEAQAQGTVDQPATALVMPTDDILNEGVLIRTALQRQRDLQVRAQTSDPRLDPSLARQPAVRKQVVQVASVSAPIWDPILPTRRVLSGSK